MTGTLAEYICELAENWRLLSCGLLAWLPSVDTTARSVELRKSPSRRKASGNSASVRMPWPVAYCASASPMTVASESWSSEGMPGLRRYTSTMAGWSCRFSPTPTRSTVVEMPSGLRSAGSPTPESSRSWGDWTAPADRMTSRVAVCRRGMEASETDQEGREQAGEGRTTVRVSPPPVGTSETPSATTSPVVPERQSICVTCALRTTTTFEARATASERTESAKRKKSEKEGEEERGDARYSTE